MASNPSPSGGATTEGKGVAGSGGANANITSSVAAAGVGGVIQRQDSIDKIVASSGAVVPQPSITKTLFSYFSGVGGLGKSSDSHSVTTTTTVEHRSETVDNPMTAHTGTIDNSSTKNGTTIVEDSHPANILYGKASEDLGGMIPSNSSKTITPRTIDAAAAVTAVDEDEQKLFEQFVNMVSESESPSLKEKESTEVLSVAAEDTADSLRQCKTPHHILLLDRLLARILIVLESLTV